MPYSHVESTDTDRLEDLANSLAKATRVVVITGAGISTSCGIPDFRSQDGLYSLMKETHEKSSQGSPRPIKGAELFNSNLFRDEDKSRTFYRFMASLREKCNSTRRTSATHKFIRKLRDQQKLVRCYTQNIDGFEAREDVCMDLSRGPGHRHRMAKKALEAARSDLTTAAGGVHDAGCEAVPLHGDLASLRCTVCSHIQSWTQDAQTTFLKGEVPSCPECDTQHMIRQALGKRNVRSGSLRPNVILYGEEHPGTDMISRIRCNDLNLKPDLLLVMGTSLKVDGLKMLVREFAQTVHNKKGGRVVFVNLTQPAASTWGDVFDTWVDMDCDSWVNDMRSRRKDIWQTQGQLDETLSPPTRRTPSSAINKQASRLSRPMNRQNDIMVLVDDEQKSEGKGSRRLKRSSADADLTEPAPQKRRAVFRPSDASNREKPSSAKSEQCTDANDTITVSTASLNRPAERRSLDRVTKPSKPDRSSQAGKTASTRTSSSKPLQKLLDRTSKQANPRARRILGLSRGQGNVNRTSARNTHSSAASIGNQFQVVKVHTRNNDVVSRKMNMASDKENMVFLNEL